MFEPELIKKELFNSILESEAYVNYQKIKEGIYFGEIIKVELTWNSNNLPSIVFLIFYNDGGIKKGIYAKYPLFGNGKNYTISSLAPVALSKGIFITSNMCNKELLISLGRLRNSFVHFYVEITKTNKNIRLCLSNTIYNNCGVSSPFKEVIKM